MCSLEITLEPIIYGARSSAPEWPSWVPDLRIPFLRNHLRHLRKFQASKKTHAKYRFLNKQDTTSTRLRTKGIRLDFIDDIAASPSLNDLPIYPSQNSNRYNSNMAQILGQTLVMNHPKTREYLALMELHRHVGNEKFSPMYQESIWASLHDKKDFQDFQKFREKNRNFPINGRPLQTYFPTQPRKLKTNNVKTLLDHIHLATVSLKGRRLVTTSRGHICLVPEAVKKGDVVVILLGCNFPVLLRRYGKSHRVLEECYVYGFMGGEMFGAKER